MESRRPDVADSLLQRKMIPVLVAMFVAGAGAAQPERVTIMTYNVKNMYDVFDDPYTFDEGTPVKPRVEIKLIASLIAKLDPDIVAFEELENEGVLKAMVREMLPDGGYQYVAAMPTNSGRGGNLGLISRQPIVSLTSHRFTDLALEMDHKNRAWRFARDLLRIRIKLTARQVLDLYIAHFKSRRDSGSDTKSRHWRLAEAIAARRIIDRDRRRHPEHWMLLLGDLNDTPGSKTLQALLAPGQQPAAVAPLIDLHVRLQSQDRITYLRRPYRTTVDYMLASPALAGRLVPGSAHVVSDDLFLGGSDHAPVLATFDLAGLK